MMVHLYVYCPNCSWKFKIGETPIHQAHRVPDEIECPFCGYVGEVKR